VRLCYYVDLLVILTAKISQFDLQVEFVISSVGLQAEFVISSMVLRGMFNKSAYPGVGLYARHFLFYHIVRTLLVHLHLSNPSRFVALPMDASSIQLCLVGDSLSKVTLLHALFFV
jgi:hypothetical protein